MNCRLRVKIPSLKEFNIQVTACSLTTLNYDRFSQYIRHCLQPIHQEFDVDGPRRFRFKYLFEQQARFCGTVADHLLFYKKKTLLASRARKDSSHHERYVGLSTCSIAKRSNHRIEMASISYNCGVQKPSRSDCRDLRCQHKESPTQPTKALTARSLLLRLCQIHGLRQCSRFQSLETGCQVS